MPDDAVLDPIAAGRYLGGTKPLTAQGLAVRRLKGTGPQYFKLGRYVRYRRADLDAWIDERVRTSTSDMA